MAELETLAAGPPAPGPLSLDTAYLSNNFASLAGTNTAVQAGATAYTYSAYSYSAPGGTVDVPGLSEGAINGSNGEATGWAALSDTIKYVIYAAAGVVGLLVIGIVIWLLVRKSKKRKAEEARQNARLTTRSSFASPMHERETMPPQSASAFNFNDPHGSMGEYAEKNAPGGGVYRTDTNYTNGSAEKNRGVYADAQSVHSIPPSYANGYKGHGGRQDQDQNNVNYRNNAGDLSGATLLDDNVTSRPSEDENNAPVHHMLANVNTGLSSYRAVPPPGSKPAPMPNVQEPSYPPRLQSINPNMVGQERSGTPLSAARRQPQQQQYSPRDAYQQQQQQQQQFYNRNGPPHQQQQYANNTRQVPPSPAYSQSTLASARNRHDEDFASPQGYFTPNEGTPTTPNGQIQQPSQAAIIAASAGAGAGHRYRQPPQNRNTRAQSPPLNPAAAYQNPYAAFAEDGDANNGSYPAGQDQGRRTDDYRADPRQQQYRQQQPQRQYDASDSYFPAQNVQQPQQQNYNAAYDNYRQY